MESLGKTEVVDKQREIRHLIENSVIPASPLNAISAAFGSALISTAASRMRLRAGDNEPMGVSSDGGDEVMLRLGNAVRAERGFHRSFYAHA